MKLLRLFVLFLASMAIGSELPSHLQYVYPKPNSTHVSQHTTIIQRFNNLQYDESFDYFTVKENGKRVGGQTILSSDKRTLIFEPNHTFEKGSAIEATINCNKNEPPYTFSFKISSTQILENQSLFSHEIEPVSEPYQSYGKPTMVNGVSVPSDFPVFKPSTNKATAPGYIFINNWQGVPYIMIFKNDGTPFFYRRVEERSRDFKVQPGGILSRRVRAGVHGFATMDKNYNQLEELNCKHGYGTDEHELQITENGHALMIGLDYSKVDMSKLVAGGKSNATLIDNIVQELDADRNVIFEWRGFDYFDVMDATHRYRLTSNSVDVIHMNSIAVDYDDNLVISSRYISECTKINRQTGEIIWRLGGYNNEFEFINDDDPFNGQHDFRPVPGKPNHYTLFDNGDLHSPQYSRAVEYRLDTENMTAEKVWEYDHNKKRYSHFMGNVQRLPNGNTLINWAVPSYPKACEVTPDGNIVYEGNFVLGTDTYRAFRFEWDGFLEKPYLITESSLTGVTLIYNKFGDDAVKEYKIYAGRKGQSLIHVATTSEPMIVLGADVLDNSTTYSFRVKPVYDDGSVGSSSNTESVKTQFLEPGTNLLANGDFSDGLDNWELTLSGGADCNPVVKDGELHLNIGNGGGAVYNVQFKQLGIQLVKGVKYVFEFDAYATSKRTVDAKLERDGSPWENYTQNSPTLLSTRKRHYAYEFVMEDPTDNAARVVFNSGDHNADIYIDNVSVSLAAPATVQKNENKLTDFKLAQNYPNPFNPKTTIKYTVGQKSHIQIKVYNLLGELVSERVDEQQSPGTYSTEFNGSNLGSGLYFYEMTATTESNNVIRKMGKMTILK